MEVLAADEIWKRICKFLSPRDVAQCIAVVCRHGQKIAFAEETWEEFCKDWRGIMHRHAPSWYFTYRDGIPFNPGQYIFYYSYDCHAVRFELPDSALHPVIPRFQFTMEYQTDAVDMVQIAGRYYYHYHVTGPGSLDIYFLHVFAHDLPSDTPEPLVSLVKQARLVAAYIVNGVLVYRGCLVSVYALRLLRLLPNPYIAFNGSPDADVFVDGGQFAV